VLGNSISPAAISGIIQTGNVAPSDLTGATITNPLFTDATQVTCGVTGESTDPDGDQITSYYTIEKFEASVWSELSGPATEPVFTGLTLAEGDVLRCKSYTSDGTADSKAVLSDSVTVGVHYRYYRFRITKVDASASPNRQASFGLELYWDNTFQSSAMTGASSGTIGGVPASVSSANNYSASYKAFRAFDNSNLYSTEKNAFDTSGNEISAQWLKVDLGAGYKKNIKGFKINGITNYFPIHFHLEASDDNATWTQVSPSYELGSYSESVSGKAYTWP